MSNPNYQHFAKQFVDLWQEQLSTMMNSKDFVHSMLEMVEYMQYPQKTNPNDTASAHDQKAPSAADFAVSLKPLYDKLVELEQRVVACEAQFRTFAEQSSGAKPSSAKHANSSGRSRATKRDPK